MLFIDEISMVSQKVFDCVEYLCRSIRGLDTPFGGMQVIGCGDFFQLPPVPDSLYGDNGNYCFQSPVFDNVFPHRIVLKNVHRQSENHLIDAINELERGFPSGKTNDLLKNLSRPLNPTVEYKAKRLFARNRDVDLHNYRELKKVDNPLHVFEATDYGDRHYLNKILAPKRLGIKVDSPVMLLRNISNRFVNGLVGRVLEIQPHCIKVAFNVDGKTETVDIKRFTFSKYDPATNMCIASRHQFPIKLAYAMTIHKSEGMTIRELVIDCRHVMNPGQIGVALGRAESIDGMQVLNYKPSLCKKNPDTVYEFYHKIYERSSGNDDIRPDVYCCRNHTYNSGNRLL